MWSWKALEAPSCASHSCLRINSLVRGCSGVTRGTLETLISALHNNCVPRIPSQGSVGASGDLCPLAHLSLPFLHGEKGYKLYDPAEEKYLEASVVMAKYNIKPLDLQGKEGLALINGTQFITALTAQALNTARNAWKHSLIAAAISTTALKGDPSVYDPQIHQVRPHLGQKQTAAIMESLLRGSECLQGHKGKKQDAYCLRCIPQIAGPFVEVSNLVETIILTEINSITDNPLIFSNGVLSGGNFHGQYPGKAADLLSTVIPDICNVSERRTARMVDAKLSNLPAFLISQNLGGLHSGMMIPAYTAAALTAESKFLAHPSSVDTIPTCANQEDHVSMGAHAARKALASAKIAEKVVAIEILLACQALDISELQISTCSPSVKEVHELVRKHVPTLEEDRDLSKDIKKVVQLVRSGDLLKGLAALFPVWT